MGVNREESLVSPLPPLSVSLSLHLTLTSHVNETVVLRETQQQHALSFELELLIESGSSLLCVSQLICKDTPGSLHLYTLGSF